MSIKDKYQFNSSLGELKPTNSSLSWQWRKDGDDGFFIKELATELRLQNIAVENIFDFDKIYQKVQARDICEKIDLNVDKSCKEGGSSEFFHGYLSIIDGKYDIDRCEAHIKPRSLDGLSCLVDNWEREHNFFSFGSAVTATRIEGQIETVECQGVIQNLRDDTFLGPNGEIQWQYDASCLPSTSGSVINFYGFTPIKTRMEFGYAGTINTPHKGEWRITTTWVREKWIGSSPPTSSGWTNDGGEYYRPVNTIPKTESAQYAQDMTQVFTYLNAIGNGRYLNEVLVNLINQGCNYTIISNFFGINPDGTEPANIAYDYAHDNTQELMLFDKHTAKIPDVDELATKAKINLKQLWRDLRTIFNLEIRLVDGILRIEHVSYFQNRFMLDLTRPDLQYSIKYKGQFEYKKDELPRFEKFSWMDNLEQPFFDDGLIEYQGVCVDTEENKEILMAVQTITTNLDDMARQPEEVQDEGFALVATNNHVILRGGPEGFNSGYVNGVLSWDWLFRYVHRWNRKKTFGLMNGDNTQFIGRPKNRLQKDIKIHVCCEEIDEFSPDDLVKTQFGWGAIESATYDDPNEILTLNLLHD